MLRFQSLLQVLLGEHFQRDQIHDGQACRAILLQVFSPVTNYPLSQKQKQNDPRKFEDTANPTPLY